MKPKKRQAPAVSASCHWMARGRGDLAVPRPIPKGRALQVGQEPDLDAALLRAGGLLPGPAARLTSL